MLKKIIGVSFISLSEVYLHYYNDPRELSKKIKKSINSKYTSMFNPEINLEDCLELKINENYSNSLYKDLDLLNKMIQKLSPLELENSENKYSNNQFNVKNLSELELIKLNLLNEKYSKEVNKHINRLEQENLKLMNKRIILESQRSKVSEEISQLEKEFLEENQKQYQEFNQVEENVKVLVKEKNLALELLDTKEKEYRDIVKEYKDNLSLNKVNEVFEKSITQQNREIDSLVVKINKAYNDEEELILNKYQLEDLKKEITDKIMEIHNSNLNIPHNTSKDVLTCSSNSDTSLYQEIDSLHEKTLNKIDTIYQTLKIKERELQQANTDFLVSLNNHTTQIKKKFLLANKLNTFEKVANQLEEIYQLELNKVSRSESPAKSYFAREKYLNRAFTHKVFNYLKEIDGLISNKELNIITNDDYLTVLYRTKNIQLYQTIKLFYGQIKIGNFDSDISIRDHDIKTYFIDRLVSLKKLSEKFNDNFATSLISELQLEKDFYSDKLLFNQWRGDFNSVICDLVISESIKNFYKKDRRLNPNEYVMEIINKNSFLSNLIKRIEKFRIEYLNERFFLHHVAGYNLLCKIPFLKYNPVFNATRNFRADDSVINRVRLICYIDYCLKNNEFDKALELLDDICYLYESDIKMKNELKKEMPKSNSDESNKDNDKNNSDALSIKEMNYKRIIELRNNISLTRKREIYIGLLENHYFINQSILEKNKYLI